MPTELKNQKCPICGEEKLSLREEEIDIPHFGITYIFSMTCEGCGYRKSDVESAGEKPPVKYEFEITGDKDLSVRVVKSGDATVNIPRIMTIEPGSESEGYVTNVEGLLTRVKWALESAMNAEEDEDAQQKLRNMIKKVNNVMAGHEPLKIIIEDPTGNSAIISEKAKKTESKLKKAKNSKATESHPGYDAICGGVQS